MTTTTATTSGGTAAATAAAAASSAAVNGAGIAVTLGIGSGIDTGALVSQLAAAQKAAPQQLITSRQAANTAQVSSLAGISGGIDSFASALKTLVAGGSLFTQPTSSDGAIGVAAIAGSRIDSALSASLQVKQLAQGQTLVSAGVADPTAAIGTGTLTLKTAAGSTTVTVDSGNNSMAGLAAAINAAKAGVTASVVNDGTGSRLVLKGGTGAAGAFTLTPDAGAAPGLSAYAYDPASGANGLSVAQAAQDATLVLDGVTVTRGSNTVSDLIPGVKLTLSAATAAPVAIGAAVPTDAIAEAVQDFVSAYNQVKGTLDGATASGAAGAAAGPFASDSTMRGVVTQLSQLTSTPLVSSGAVRTLADLGVKTNPNDGTLSVDTAKLNSVLAAQPDAVAALFNPTQATSDANVRVTSAMGSVAPGSYQLTDLHAGPPPSGKVNGMAMQVIGSRLVAPPKSGAEGLVLAVAADTASATLTVEPGLSGALQSIRDKLRSATGPLQALSDQLSTQARQITADQATLDTRSAAYQARLSSSFGAMNSRVSVLKATQSYLEQQIKVWTNDTGN